MSINLKDYIEQVDSILFVKEDCELIIDMLNYKMNDNMYITDNNTIFVDNLISKIEFIDGTSFNIILDYACDIFLNEDSMINEDNYIRIKYPKTSQILQANLNVENIREQVKYTERLLAGKVIFKDTNHLFNKVYHLYEDKDMDLVHMEVLLSQTLRARTDPGLPARVVKPFDPVMMNIKQIPFKGNFVSGLMFEDINKAINHGLIQEKDFPPSILEKLFTGELLV